MIEFPCLPSGEKPIWNGENFNINGRSARVIAYSSNFTGWDDDLTALHEAEAGDGKHPIDFESRRWAIDALRNYNIPVDGTILEIGCSSGFLLCDLKKEFPQAEIIGADIVLKPLERLGQKLPGVALVQMDLLQSPLKGRQFDAIIALNVLEHIDNDVKALENMAGLLKSDGILVLEVPQGPGLFDYYDAYLRHFRRYSKKELVAKVENAGFLIKNFNFLGFVAYIPFFIVKKMNRLWTSRGADDSVHVEMQVRNKIKITSKSRILEFVFALERMLSSRLSFPVGIRCRIVASLK